MRKTVLFIAVLLVSINGLVAQESIKFTKLSWKQALAKAELEDKLIFVDAFADWCGPCKWMAANAFQDEEVAKFMNKTYICTQIDMESEFGKKFDGVYEVSAYPTLFFIDSDGEVVKKSVGALTAKQLLSLAKRVDNPSLSQANKLKAKYIAGDHSQELMEKYFEAIDEEDIEVDTLIVEAYSALLLKLYNNDKSIGNQEKLLEFTLFNDVEVDSVIIQDYLNKMKGEDLTKKIPFVVFYYYIDNINHPLSTYFTKNYEDIYGQWEEYAQKTMINLLLKSIEDYKSGKIKREEIYAFIKDFTQNDEDYNDWKSQVDDILDED